MRIKKLLGPLVLAVFASVTSACGGGAGWFYPYDYDYDFDWDWDNRFGWWGTPYGGYTIVHRPVRVVDGWTGNAFRHRAYRHYNVRRHHSSDIGYTATNAGRTIDVQLKPMGDSTRLEVRARKGRNDWDQANAKRVASSILKEQK